ncbi:cilia- and flagella-associated protein 251 isoform X5 [Pseudorca crassidens]|uniref:cilia- and flagella-associated protein 251 isoform X5 n=1 Tax=Pseudorca crassidens TaxID=82174 RepID=UPI00352BE444
MLKISLETSPKRRMSDAEENPLEETEEYGEIEMEEGEEEEEEEEEKYPNDEGLENMQQELKEDNTLAWRGSQEEGEAEGEGAEGKEEGEEFGKEEAAGAQEETTVKPQEITKSMISLERLTPTDSQSILSGTLPKTYSGRESKHSLQSELLETFELPSMASQLEFLDLDLTTSAGQQLSSPEKQPSGELAERTDQRPQDELGQEKRHLEPERGDLEPEKREGRKETRVLYVNEKKEKEFQPKARIPKGSLVSTATEDILFQKDDGANVYPLSYLTFNPTNNKELVSNSKTQAIYYKWYEEGDILVHSAPLLTEKTFNKLVGKFSQSVFHLNLTQILSATMEGKLVVWDIYRPPRSASTSLGFPHITPCKLVHLQKEGITVLTTVDSYVVTGDIRGNIKFYDHTLSIVNWYSHFKLSSIRSLSFSKTPATPPTENTNYPPDYTLKGDLFIVRNFIIGTSDASVYHLTADGTKLEKLFVEPKDAICAISCHPYQPLIAIGSFCGMIKVWDYEQKKYLFSRIFEKGLGVQSLTYNPEGALLGAGFTEGTVYILDAMSLESETPEPFKYSRTSVTHVSFSHDSQYMATADVSFTVAVYVVRVKNGRRVWEYLARLRSHRKSIRSVLFGVHLDSNEPRLLSLGRDRLLIEYNLLKSYKDHLEVLDIQRTDQGSYPTCMVWYPPLTKELFLLICNSGYKVKLFNSTTKMCRKTLLGPVYGSPIEQIQILPVKTPLELQKRYMVFINRDKVGLQILPVDGNPHKTSALICHPSGAAGMDVSYDGRYTFTAGGQDRSVVQWEINLSALEAAVSLGGEDLTPFYGLVSGGREGKFYRELEDYFYYSQLRSQGIDTMETRKVSEHICLSELPFVMRAIGFYPSEEKIEDMFNEIRFSEYVDTGKLIDKINLPDFFKVYLNHRPPFGNTMSGIQRSFDILGFTNSKGKKAIRREDFLKLLQTKGEHMTEEEMSDCFATLFGLNPEGWKSEPAASSVKGSEICFEEELPDEITAEIFTTQILGLTISQDSGQDPTVSEVERSA